MSDPQTDKILKDVLTEETYKELKQLGAEPEHLLKLYHQSGRDKELFRERSQQLLEKDVLENLETQIETYREMIETSQKLRKGIIHDFLLEEKP